MAHCSLACCRPLGVWPLGLLFPMTLLSLPSYTSLCPSHLSVPFPMPPSYPPPHAPFCLSLIHHPQAPSLSCDLHIGFADWGWGCGLVPLS